MFNIISFEVRQYDIFDIEEICYEDDDKLFIRLAPFLHAM